MFPGPVEESGATVASGASPSLAAHTYTHIGDRQLIIGMATSNSDDCPCRRSADCES